MPLLMWCGQMEDTQRPAHCHVTLMSGHHYEEQVCGEEMGQKEKQIVHCGER